MNDQLVGRLTRSSARILVAIENPHTEEALVRLAAALTASTNGELHLAHVIAHGNGRDASDKLARLTQLASEAGVKAVPHLLEGEDVTAAIRQAIGDWGCDTMVMGWRADVAPDAVLSSQNRQLTKSVDVDTLIYKGKTPQPAHKILVPMGGGSHSLMGVQIARDLADEWHSEMEVVRVARDQECRSEDPILKRYCDQLYEDTKLQLNLLDIETPISVVAAADIVAPIVGRAAHFDLLVLGASNDWRQEEYLAGSIPDEIAYNSPASVLMVRSRAPSQHRLSSIFWEHTIRLELQPTDKWDAIDQMVNILLEEKQIPLSQIRPIREAARARELKGSTSIGRETAIPHAPIPNLPGIIGALGICPQGIDFDAADGKLVRYIFLLLTPQQNYRTYIPVLAQIASFMYSDEARANVLRCETPAEVTALIKKQDSSRPNP